MDKLKVGWFSFSCCEDSTIIFTELLNDHYKEWIKLLDFRSALVLQRKENLSDIDVSFVEGAITSKEQEDRLKKIREVSKKVVAIGSCACTGMPSGQRNDFDAIKRAEIESLMARFSYAETVQKIADVISIDAQVGGCPMSETGFVETLNKYLIEFGVVSTVNSQK